MNGRHEDHYQAGVLAFNKRDIDGALALMTQDVSWPKASEGGKVVGKEEIRAYWTRQWDEFNPHVEPLATAEEDGGKTRVRVHQHGPYRHHLQLVQRSESKP